MQIFKIELTMQELELIGEQLGKGEFSKVRGIIANLEQQVNNQIAQNHPAAPESKKIKDRLNGKGKEIKLEPTV